MTAHETSASSSLREYVSNSGLLVVIAICERLDAECDLRRYLLDADRHLGWHLHRDADCPEFLAIPATRLCTIMAAMTKSGMVTTASLATCLMSLAMVAMSSALVGRFLRRSTSA